MYLLDTDVLLELRRAKSGQSDRGLANWAASATRQNLFVSAVSVLEVGNSATGMERRNKDAAAKLRQWLQDQVLPAFEGRILPVDAAVVRRRLHLAYTDSRDGLLAATALEHGLTLVTRQTKSFRTGKVKLFNPWGYAPEAEDDDADWSQAGKTSPFWLKNLFVRT